MATTRAEDKTDKAIIRLLLDNPMGLTIGDITAQAKCSPLQARKSLARIKADKDASGQLYLLHDDDEPVQAEPAPEPQAVQAEPEQATVQYKNNDIVMILWSDADAHPDQKEMIGTVRMIELAYVRSQAPGTPEFVVLTKGNNGKVFAWRPQQVRLATKSEIEAAGDLAPAFDHSAEHVLEKASTTLPAPPAEVVLPPLTGLQQRILTLLGQHRGLTAQRIADDLHEPHLHVEQALLALGSRVTSRPLALPEIRVWECARASTEDVAHSTPLSEEERVNFLSNVLRSNQCSLELRFPVSDQPIEVRITEYMEDGPVISEFELARDAYRRAIESAADPFDHFC